MQNYEIFCIYARFFVLLHKILKIMTQILNQSLVNQATEWIHSAQKIVILTHMAPDGDAMGSALAMYHFLTDKQVTVITPNTFPAFFNWMPGADKIAIYESAPQQCDELIAQADLFICTDFNEPKRINPAGDKMVANAAPKIVFDHHILVPDTPISNPQTPVVLFSVPSASSACEVVFRFLSSFHFPLSADIATCLYTGLMTDTGNFSYNSTNCELYEIVAELIRAGAQKDEIYNAVFNQYSVDKVRLTGYALYRKMRIYPEYHLALITLTADELDQYHYQPGDTEGLVNEPLQIATVHYSVFMREERAKPGTTRSRIRISFRSQGDRPVNVWAGEVFHGGGHANASGGEMFGSIAQAVKLFEQTFPKYIQKEEKI